MNDSDMKRRWRVAAATTLTVVAIGLCVACGGVEPHAFSAAQVEQIDQRFNETGMQPEYEPLTDEQFRTVCLNLGIISDFSQNPLNPLAQFSNPQR